MVAEVEKAPCSCVCEPLLRRETWLSFLVGVRVEGVGRKKTCDTVDWAEKMLEESLSLALRDILGVDPRAVARRNRLVIVDVTDALDRMEGVRL
jgi:hypothetical protein